MNFTRDELEDIWENKPHGHFTRLVKSRKNMTRYTVTTEARRTVIVDAIKHDVWAKDVASARQQAHTAAANELRRRLNLSAWDDTTTYVTTAKVA